jgi:hypothetical protein
MTMIIIQWFFFFIENIQWLITITFVKLLHSLIDLTFCEIFLSDTQYGVEEILITVVKLILK